MTSRLQDYVTRQAERRPEAVAIVMDENLTYGELEQASNRLARLLREAGCRRGDRICLFLPKSPYAIVSMLGVLKAGCAYVPVDLASPAARVEKIVQAAEPRFGLANASARELLDDLFRRGAVPTIPIGSVDDAAVDGEQFQSRFQRADWTSHAPNSLDLAGSSDDLAHILFTSGSTGSPKGVMITHANVVSFVSWATGYFGMTTSDRMSGHPPLHFDLSTFDIYGTFCVGGQLHLIPQASSLMPHQLAEFIRSAELTQWFSVPSAMTYMARFDVLRQADFPTLKRVLWCGEVLPTPTLIYWMRRLPHVQFTNLYGPTEATIASSYYTVPGCPRSERESVPIGTACEGEELLILDNALRPVCPGDIGDLYIGGVGLSPGYWRDAEKTRNAFLPDFRSPDSGARIYRTGDVARVADNGLVYFLGRADTQIKSRGYRIELGEIETALNALIDVKECAVVGVALGGFEGTTICCAYATINGEVTAAKLRGQLRKVLPDYMLPLRWRAFDALPRNANGKIDRRLLRELFEQNVRDAAGRWGSR
jgi:amino acid adenylation domain-containing protein